MDCVYPTQAVTTRECGSEPRHGAVDDERRYRRPLLVQLTRGGVGGDPREAPRAAGGGDGSGRLGERGVLTIRERNEWIDTGDAYVAYGRWSVVRGTGQYAQVTGRGRSVGVGQDRGEGAWFTRHEGYLTAG